MKCDVEEIDKCNRKLKIEIPLGDYNARLKSYYQRLSREVKFPGFRPGKVPQSMMEKKYGPEVKREVLTQLVSDSIQLGIQQSRLKTVGDPSVVEVQAEEGTDITVTANVEILPEITVNEVSGIEVPLKIAKVTDEDVDKTIESFREQRATNRQITDRGVQKDDLVKLDFDSTLNGKPYDNNSANDYIVQIGASHLVAGFDEEMMGMQIGEERHFKLSMPDSHPNTQVAGKEVEFKVILKGIQVKELPELDDAFAQTVDPNNKYENVDDMKAGIRKSLEDYERKQARKNALDSLAAKLAEANPVDIPEKLVQEQIKFMVAKDKQQDGAGHTHEGNEEVVISPDDEKKFREQAVKMLQQELVINQFTEDLNLEVTEQELDKEMQGFMSLLGIQDLKKMKKEWAQSGALLRLHNRMRREKTLESLMEQVQTTEEMVDRDQMQPDNVL